MRIRLDDVERGTQLHLSASVGGVRVGRATLDFAAQRARGAPLFRTAWVEPEWRSRGIGSALLRRAEELAAERGHDALDLLVRHDNPRALELYRRLGYEVVGEEVNRYVDGSGDTVTEDCWSLTRRL